MLHIFQSGSKGNLAYFETAETRLLIDCGLSEKAIRRHLASIGRTPETLNGVLLTHEHADHALGVGMFRRINVPVYCVPGVVPHCQMVPREIGDIQIAAFEVSHDATCPLGFDLTVEGRRTRWLTDLGSWRGLPITEVDTLVIEANYDPEMLAQSETKHPSLKARICSEKGHLANSVAASYARQLRGLNHVRLIHLSDDCNTPELALEAFKEFPVKIE